MVEDKRDIIIEEGVPVKVKDSLNNVLYDSSALISRATKQFYAEVSLESHRMGQFLPEVRVGNGMIIENMVSDEVCIVVANYPEIINKQLCANIARMIVCNSTLVIKEFKEEADKYGNIKKTPIDKYPPLPVYAFMLDSTLESKSPGLFHEVIYKIYCPYIDVTVEDTVFLEEVNGFTNYRVIGINNLTFKGMTVLEVVTETRR